MPALFKPKPLEADPLDFSPALLRLTDSPPNPLGRQVLWTLLALLAALLMLGAARPARHRRRRRRQTDPAKLPEDRATGRIRHRQGDSGQRRRDRSCRAGADAHGYADHRRRFQSLMAEHRRKRATLARIDAELAIGRMSRRTAMPPNCPGKWPPNTVPTGRSRSLAGRREKPSAQGASRVGLGRADPRANLPTRCRTTAHRTRPSTNWPGMALPAALMASDKKRERIEKEQELKTQDHLIASARAGISQSERKLAQIDSDYRRQLHAERNEVQGQSDRLAQELAKQSAPPDTARTQGQPGQRRQGTVHTQSGHRRATGHRAADAGAEKRHPACRSLGVQRRHRLRPAGASRSSSNSPLSHSRSTAWSKGPSSMSAPTRRTTRAARQKRAGMTRLAQEPAIGIQGAGRAQGHASGDRWPALCPWRGHADACRNSPWAANRSRVSALAGAQGLARGGQGTLSMAGFSGNRLEFDA
jgi:hypothetical protein